LWVDDVPSRTIGYVSWVGKYAEKNSVLVDSLEASGAVLYVKTNIPQTLMVNLFNAVLSFRDLNAISQFSGQKPITTSLDVR
jgi:hypothetical protein